MMKENQRINTKKPYRIDIHHHLLPKFYLEARERVGIREIFGFYLPDWSIDAHLRVMDKNKIQVGMASIPIHGFYSVGPELAIEMAHQCNQYLATILEEYPKRFGAFASLPLPDVHAAIAEAVFALDKLKLDGVLMLSNVSGKYLGEAENQELFIELDKRNAIVFVHPGDPLNNSIPSSILFPIDTALETVRAVMSLLYGGIFERFPNVIFIFAHCGGITPFLADRIVRGKNWSKGEGGADPGRLSYEMDEAQKTRLLELLKRQYYDSMTANAGTGLRTLQDFAGSSHIVLGTDHAILPAKFHPIKMRELVNYKGFDRKSCFDVERDNALRLFPRLEEIVR